MVEGLMEGAVREGAQVGQSFRIVEVLTLAPDVSLKEPFIEGAGVFDEAEQLNTKEVVLTDEELEKFMQEPEELFSCQYEKSA
jgi:hypothetical protein